MRILLVTTNVPVPYSRNGNAQRSTLLMEALSAFGEVDLFLIGNHELFEGDPYKKCLGDTRFSVAGHAIIRYGRRAEPWNTAAKVLPGPFGGNIAKTLARRKGAYLADEKTRDWMIEKTQDGTYDLVVSRYLRTAMYVGLDAVRDVPVLVDVDDIDWRLLESMLTDQPWPGLGGRVGSNLSMRLVERLCRQALRQFTYLWSASDEDAATIGMDNCIVLPNIAYPWKKDRPANRPAVAQDPARLLFVGELGWAPNSEGIDRFVERIWPRVREACPEAVFEIVGQSMTPERRERWGKHPGVEPVGFVDDLNDAYARATFTLAPIYQGAGTNIKVLESLSFGRTVALSEHGLRGFHDHLHHRDTVWLGKTDEEFAEGCIELIRNPELRAAMEAKGREVIADHYSPEVFNRAVAEVVERVLPAKVTAAPA
ncbi:MAG: glycosyltransferase family 4 protein [FCB group bacterium]|nr:glycosyltransferase family 4 protein [FCB group bacterium]